MAMKEKSETIDHPKYYGGDTVYEHVKVVKAWGLDYLLGNATKYLCRAGKKSKDTAVEDLKKAIWYIECKIKDLEEQ